MTLLDDTRCVLQTPSHFYAPNEVIRVGRPLVVILEPLFNSVCRGSNHAQALFYSSQPDLPLEFQSGFPCHAAAPDTNVQTLTDTVWISDRGLWKTRKTSPEDGAGS